MSSSFTPGPWQWYWRQEDGEANCGVFHEERKGLAYSVCRAPRYVAQEHWKANARLIAAAPDLLEALHSIVSALSAQDEEGLIEHAEPMQKARAAIARATGEAA